MKRQQCGGVLFEVSERNAGSDYRGSIALKLRV
jgi:hypothetical protein